MKREEKENAIRLRKEGKSIGEIATTLGVSRASVSAWVRDIHLSQSQRDRLNANGHSIDAIEKRRIHRIAKTREKRREIMDIAKRDIGEISSRELFLIGTALYWGEGSKTERGMVRVANSDPKLIQLMMRFFREVCLVPEAKFRGAIHTFSHLHIEDAEKYWSRTSAIPRTQFYKTYAKPSIASKSKMDGLPHGTFEIYVCDTKLFYKIKGWIERLTEFTYE